MTTEEIKSSVFEKKPIFAEIYKKYGDKNWIDYLDNNSTNTSALNSKNLELINATAQITSSVLGEKKAKETSETLKDNFFVSTADHHGILNHPFFLNSALARSHKEFINENKKTIIFSCGSISLSNSSFPRGVFFHDEHLNEIRIPLVSLKYRSRSVYGMKAISKQDLQKNFNKVIAKTDGQIQDKIELIKEKILRTQKIFEVLTLSDQFTIINDILWNETFGNSRGDLIYVELESVVRKLLLDIHLTSGSIINKILFDKKWRDSFLKNFENIQGAHDTKNKKGSHLFWYIDEKSQKRLQLFVKNDYLETIDGDIKIALTPEAIEKQLVSYRLLPTMALSFSVVSFWHGLSCGGGFSQVQYLGEMKKAWQKTLDENHKNNETNPRTDIFTGEYVLATIGKNGNAIPASLFDLYIYGSNDISEKINEKIEKTKIKETIDPMMGELFKIISGKNTQIEIRNTISPVISAKKIKNKCKYCGNNPSNHFFANLSQTATVIFLPILRIMSYVSETTAAKWLVKILFTPYFWLFRGTRMLGINKDPDKANTKRSEVIWLEAIKRGVKMEQFVLWGKPIEQYRAKIGFWWRYFESIPIPARFSTRSYIWMDDKAKLKKKFIEEKLPVAFGGSAFTWKKALEIFNKASKPVIVKPQLGSRGRHTSTNIFTEKDLKKAYKIAKQMCLFVIIEEHLVGSVYRGTYVDGKIVGILRGDPPRIIGDGTSEISQLIDIKNQNKHPDVKDVIITEQLIDFIGRLGYTVQSILPKGKVLDLSEKIGINYGGFSAEMIPKTHPKIITELERAGKFLNTPVIGFDFIIPDATKDPAGQKWGIIEANSLPFINLHHFPLEGNPINVAAKIWNLWDIKN